MSRENNQTFFRANPLPRLLKIVSLAGLTILISLILASTMQALWWDRLGVSVVVETGDYTYPRSKGYWKTTIARVVRGAKTCPTSWDPASVETLLWSISSSSTVFNFTSTGIGLLLEAEDILSQHGNDMRDKLEAHLLALWLNHVSGYANGYKVPSSSGSLSALDIILIAESAWHSGDEDSMENAKNLIEYYIGYWEHRMPDYCGSSYYDHS
jgi:hypothetical protein